MIKLTNVTKTFDDGDSFVVNDISFEVKEGETLVLLGSSGCGKTTTLKMINRLVDPTKGEIQVDEQNILECDRIQLRRSIGYVFQQIGLFPHMTVGENISIVMRLENKSLSQQISRAKELLEIVNLDSNIYVNRYPDELSGGQQQRVGVARALASNPKYLLMDEPFAALDAINRDALQSELVELRNRLQKTIIFVTHDIFEALRLGDRIAVMNRGKIEQIGSGKELVQFPKTDFVKMLFQKPIQQLTRFEDLQ